MRCKDCGFANGEDDHRCLRCGRRLAGIVIAAPAGYSGANALAMDPMLDLKAQEAHRNPMQEIPAAQPTLFPAVAERNVIPFDEVRNRFLGRPIPPVATADRTTTHQAPPTRTATRKTHAPPAAEQGSLDFVRASAAPRTTKTDGPAQIFCEQTVATPQHRLVASAIDAATILIAFGIFAGVVEFSGTSFGVGKIFWMSMGGSFALISLFYGLVWAIAGRETAGMSMADLQLITFDGFPVDPRSRAIRFVSTWLSFCSGGLGLVWAVADEENLTWHDHISKTFPTFREAPGNFVRQRRG